MNSTTLKWLGVATAGLLILMFVVDRADRSDTVSGGEYLVPGLKDRLNDISSIVVTGSGDTGSVSISRDGDGWQVKGKDGFAADVGKLREVLLAVADARILEEKTANPERFGQIGVEGPDAGRGMLLEISGENLRHSIIIGDVAQSKNRYVRMADNNQSFLIDRNPDLPAAANGWLASDVLDIDASRIQSVSIRHEDGETIRIEKSSPGDTNFAVMDIPEGRELSYATVANGIAGVLKGLTLDDVRRSDTGELTATSVFATFDGLQISVRRYRDGDATWITLAAGLAPVEPASASEDSTAEETVGSEVAIDDTVAESPGDTEAQKAAEAGAINTRHAGWQYRIPDYKANLLARRWDDILKANE